MLLAAGVMAALGSCRATGDCAPGRAAPPAVTPVRALPPTRWILGPIYGTGCPEWAACAVAPGAGMADEALDQLDHLAALDIPVSAYHFDGGAWSDGQCSWALGDAVLARLRQAGLRALLHFWGGCTAPADLDRVHGELGELMGGLYLDYGAGDDLARAATGWMASRLPGRGEVVMKAFGDPGETDDTLRAIGHTAYVDDLPNDFAGLQEGIRRVFAKGRTVGTFNELTAYAPTPPDEEVFHRRIHFGALQLVMDHSPLANADPWRHGYGSELTAAYRRFAWLHAELVPYLHSYDRAAYEDGTPVLRDADADRYTARWGDELFAAYVTAPGATSVDVVLPPGEWLDAWDLSRSGSGTVTWPAPLGREPVLFRAGAIVPLDVRRPDLGHGTAASAGHLTLLVLPGAPATFRYFDDDLDGWVTFSATTADGALGLRSSAWPSRPLLWRVVRWPTAPEGLAACGTTVVAARGGTLPRRASEAEVARAADPGWWYDADARVLVVKMAAGAGAAGVCATGAGAGAAAPPR